MKKLYFFSLLIFFSAGIFAQQKPDTVKKADWQNSKSKANVFGEVFGDYYSILKGDTLNTSNGEYQKKTKRDNAFTIRRFYLGATYDFNERFSSKLMFEGNDGNLLPNGKRSVNIKYAYVKWKNIFTGSDLIIGAQSTPTWSRFTEKIWGYRSIEKTIMDYWKQGHSNDLGVSLSGRLNSSGTIRYNFMIGNGSAQKPEFDIYKKFYGSVNARLFNQKLLLELYGDFEPQTNAQNKYTIKGFIGFQSAKFTAGLEPFIRIQKQLTNENIKIYGNTFFARGTLVDKKLFAFGRFDIFRNTNNFDHYIQSSVFGLDYSPSKKVHIMPNLWTNSYYYYNGSVLENGADIVARVTIWFKF